MYTPVDVKEKSSAQLAVDMDRIAREFGPCDIVIADIDRGVPNERIHELIDLCEKLSEKHATTP